MKTPDYNEFDDDDLLLDSEPTEPFGMESSASAENNRHAMESSALAEENRHDMESSALAEEDDRDMESPASAEEDDGPDDFYNDDDYDDEPEPGPKHKQPKLDPEDPDYWLGEQSEFERFMPKKRNLWKWWLAAAVIIVAAIVGIWMWFFRPYVDDAVKYGYIKSMERNGTFIKTFEGVLIPYREVGDTDTLYFREIPFSVDGDSLAAHMKAMMLDCIPVRLGYEEYHHPLFWKGASPMIIISADTADVNRILPPEFR